MAQAKTPFQALPSVDAVLQRPAVSELLGEFPRTVVLASVREVLSEIREALSGDRSRDGIDLLERLDQEVARRVRALFRPSLRAVINATGVVLHTNLGRAPLSAAALEAIQQTGGAYSNLEYDVGAGARGKRDVHAGALLEKLLGAPAIVVNNNAAAMLLALNELAAGGEVIISRGELIEIGDGFRIPDILARSGAEMREVGTTNRTRIDDYRRAITPRTRLLLRVHHSNFRIVGFTARPSLAEMVELSRETGIPVAEDLGSGCLVDLSAYGMESEPLVGESLAAGIDVVTFSGDKLLGGPQAGILAGKPEMVARLRRNPLFRALRVDKLIYAALGATLRDYLLEKPERVPILTMLGQTAAQIRERAERFLQTLNSMEGELVEGRSVAGGGSTPGLDLPTTLISLSPPRGVSASALERRLRTGAVPVITRLEKDRVLLDFRTVLPAQEETLSEMLRLAWGS